MVSGFNPYPDLACPHLSGIRWSGWEAVVTVPSANSGQHGLSERVWTPPLMQAVFGRLGACGQVLSCVRPLYAADDTPRARMEIRGLGPNRLRELESSPFGCWFSQPGLVDLCPYLSSVLPTSPTASRTSPFSQAVAGAR